MKILFLVHQFYPEYQSGTEKFVYNIAAMAQSFGHKVKVITYSFYNDSDYDYDDDGILTKKFFYNRIPILAFKFINPPIDLHFGLGNDLLSRFSEKLISAEAPDIVHSGHSMRVHEFIRTSIREKIPYVMTLTDFFLICPKVILAPNNNTLCSGPDNGKACRELCGEFSENFISNRLKTAREILENAKQVISPSNFVAKIFSKEMSNIDIQIIGHGIRYSHILQKNTKYQKEVKLVFGYAGTLAFHKGVHILIQAFTGIDNVNVELRIYGTGDERYVKMLMKMAGDDQRIKFCGTFSSEQIGEVLAQVDVVVIPSICYESYSLILHEAFASNVPVLASGLGGTLEKINDGINGFLFAPGDSDELKLRIKSIMDNPQTLNAMQENLRKDVLVPTIEQEAYSYNRIYSR